MSPGFSKKRVIMTECSIYNTKILLPITPNFNARARSEGSESEVSTSNDQSTYLKYVKVLLFKLSKRFFLIYFAK